MKGLAASSQIYRHLQCTVSKSTLCYALLYCKRPPDHYLDRRFYSSDEFDINKVVELNNKNKSTLIESKSVVKSVSKSSKKVVSKEVQTDVKKTLNIIDDVPDWFTFLLDTPYSGDVPVDADKFQMFKDFVEEIELKSIPSVSTVIKKTETKKQREVLERWKKEKTKELGGEEEFKKYQEGLMDKGLTIHKCIQMYLSGERDFKIKSGAEGFFESAQGVLDEVDDVRLLEEEFSHPHMFYRGKIDCLASYRGSPLLIEWKTSSTLKPTLSSTYDNPMQVAAYLGALNKSIKLKKNNLPPLTNALLVIMYKDGEPATVHPMSSKVCQRYWQRWQEKVYQYWTDLYREHIESPN